MPTNIFAKIYYHRAYLHTLSTFIVFSCLLLPLKLDAEEVDNLRNSSLIGEAFSLDNGQLLYREFHRWLDDGSHSVYYKDGAGQTILLKQLQYEQSMSQPDLSHENFLAGETINIDVNHHKRSIQIEYRKNSKSPLRSARIALDRKTVIDSGFHFFIVDHWRELRENKKIDFRYLVPARLKDYQFSITAVNCSEQFGTDFDGRLLCFQISPDNFVVQLLVRPVYLAYERNSKQLVRYRGLGNVASAKGKYLAVDIRYQSMTEEGIVHWANHPTFATD